MVTVLLYSRTVNPPMGKLVLSLPRVLVTRLPPIRQMEGMSKMEGRMAKLAGKTTVEGNPMAGMATVEGKPKAGMATLEGNPKARMTTLEGKTTTLERIPMATREEGNPKVIMVTMDWNPKAVILQLEGVPVIPIPQMGISPQLEGVRVLLSQQIFPIPQMEGNPLPPPSPRLVLPRLRLQLSVFLHRVLSNFLWSFY